MKKFIKKIFLSLCLVGYALHSSDHDQKRNVIIHFNIGGYHWDTTSESIKQFGGDYLQTLISGKFSVNKDDDGYIFIDRPPSEGEIISNYILTKTLPQKYEISYLKAVGDFYGLPLIDSNNLKREKRTFKKWHGKEFWSQIMKCYAHEDTAACTEYCKQRHTWIFGFEQTTSCPLCDVKDKGCFAEALKHLVDNHDADVVFSHKEAFGSWEIWYRLPDEELF